MILSYLVKKKKKNLTLPGLPSTYSIDNRLIDNLNTTENQGLVLSHCGANKLQPSKSGASSGFQPNQGKIQNFKRSLFLINVAYKP